MTDVTRAVAEAHRREWGLVLAATARDARDLDLAEESVQEAYAAALSAWPVSGIPAGPAAWLTTVARRRALDTIRREQVFHTKLPLLVEPSSVEPGDGKEPEMPEDAVADERLRLVSCAATPRRP